MEGEEGKEGEEEGEEGGDADQPHQVDGVSEELPEVLLETCCEVSALARSEKKVGGKKKSLLEGSDRFRGEGCGELAAEEAAAWSR